MGKSFTTALGLTLLHTAKGAPLMQNDSASLQNVMDLLLNCTRNSSGNEIVNVHFLYDDIVHAVKIQ